MRAARYRSYGSPEAIRIEEVENPVPADGELLVRVHAATVSRSDCAILAAHPFFMRLFTGLIAPRKETLGTDFAGRVEAVGARVTKYAVGDRVWGFEELGAGSHAEYLVIAEGGALAHMPAELDFNDGAACMEDAFYAWSYLNKVKVGHESSCDDQRGDGCDRLSAPSTLRGRRRHGDRRGRHEEPRSLGFPRRRAVHHYLKEDFTDDTATYDCVFDAVGKSTFRRCRRLLKPGGVYMSSELGPGWENLVLPTITRSPWSALQTSRRKEAPKTRSVNSSPPEVPLLFLRSYILAAHVLGLTAAWHHDAIFDYADRFMSVSFQTASTLPGNPFYVNMWEAYRAIDGCSWVSTNPTDPASNGTRKNCP